MSKLNAEHKRLIAKYGDMFSTTGGNDIQELIEREGVTIQTNAVVVTLMVACEAQLGLLVRLDRAGLLKSPKK